MKRFFIITFTLIFLLVVGVIGAVVLTMHHLQDKGEQVKAGVQRWIGEKRNPAAIIEMVKGIPELMKHGEFRQTEQLLDLALKKLEEPVSKDEPAPSVYTEPESDDYSEPQEVGITGYDGQVMEPFISPDGKFLFFNNENDPADETDIHFAQRTGDTSFKYLGALPGVNVKDKLDAVPSMDSEGHFYFTTLRDYGKSFDSIYTGMFNGTGVLDVKPAAGTISPSTAGEINMDTGISPDGKTMYISRALFRQGETVPQASNILVAHAGPKGFEIDPDSADIMKNVNTEDLEYAPAISGDGLSLFFTRAKAGGLYGLRILVATRAALDQPFGEPHSIKSISGFVEAPTVPLDGKELFFHMKSQDKLRLFRVVRK